MHRTANSIANAQAVPKERTPIHSHVNGKRARCYSCGPVRVKTIESAHIGTGKLDVCARCNAVIQTEPNVIQTEPKPKNGNRYGLAQGEAEVLTLLESKLGHCVPYDEFQMERAVLFVRVAAIRRKVPDLKISAKTRGGYTLEFWNKDEPQIDSSDPQYRWYCEKGHEWKDVSRFDVVMTENGLKPACPTCGLEVVQAEKS